MWAAAAVLMYPMGLVYEATIGPASTPPTVVAGGRADGGGRGLDRPGRHAQALPLLLRRAGGRPSPTEGAITGLSGWPCVGTSARPSRTSEKGDPS
jgi:hypothetical protein